MNKMMTGIVFIPWNRVAKKRQDPCLPQNAKFVDVSKYGSEGWNVLSPMYDHGGIPVPGMPGATSRTVEGIWQGLKRFPEVPEDLAMLKSGKPKKRRGKPLGHVFEGEVLNGVVEARRVIYIPAYRWMVENCASANAKFKELQELARTHMVYVYDRDNNGDPLQDKPYAHAALLVDMVKAEQKKAPVTP